MEGEEEEEGEVGEAVEEGAVAEKALGRVEVTREAAKRRAKRGSVETVSGEVVVGGG